jgi:hypothetical protein
MRQRSVTESCPRRGRLQTRRRTQLFRLQKIRRGELRTRATPNRGHAMPLPSGVPVGAVLDITTLTPCGDHALIHRFTLYVQVRMYLFCCSRFCGDNPSRRHTDNFRPCPDTQHIIETLTEHSIKVRSKSALQFRPTQSHPTIHQGSFHRLFATIAAHSLALSSSLRRA